MAKNARKFILLGLIVAMCFSLTACTLFEFDGKSAYEIAVDNGFVGTESEWLASLKGSSGRNGADAPRETIEDIYAAYVNRGGEASFEEFLAEYLTGYGEDGGNDTSYAANVALRSTVIVHAYFNGSGSAGAGVIFSLDREEGSAYIVTNYHVVYDGLILPSKIEVILYGKEGFYNANNTAKYAMSAALVGGSAEYDIAVLFVASDDQLKSEFVIAAAVADDAVYPGDSVLAVGNPSNEGLSVTAGIVSQDSQIVTMSSRVDGTAGTQEMRLIRIDAPVNSGNSGGGLFNERGELVGIVNGKMLSVVEEKDGSLTPTNIENIAYAIPTSAAIGAAENIRDQNNGNGSKIVVGVTLSASDVTTVYDETTKKVNIIQKVVVGVVNNNSLAFRNLVIGDEILNITIKNSDGEVKVSKDITRSYQPAELLLKARVGDKIVFSVGRGNRVVDVTLNASAEYFRIF
jgi:serine protease Do